MTDAEKDIERIMVDIIDQLKKVKGKTSKDTIKLYSIIQMLLMIGAYTHAIHLGKETTDGPQERLPEGSKSD